MAVYIICMRSNSSASKVAHYEQDDQRSIPGRGDYALHCHVHNGSEAHPVYYEMETGDFFFWYKSRTKAQNWPLTSHLMPRYTYTFMVW